jgi:hypothetical protein
MMEREERQKAKGRQYPIHKIHNTTIEYTKR